MPDPLQLPTLRISRDPNHNFRARVFPLLLPAGHLKWQGQDRLQILPGPGLDLKPFQARILSVYSYPNLEAVSDGFLQLVAGKADAEKVRERYRRHFQRYVPLDQTAFRVYILIRC